MRKYILYIVLTGFVLGIVYQAGRNSTESQSSPDETDRKLALVSENLSRIESLRSGNVPAARISPSSVVNSENVPVVEPSVERYQFRQVPVSGGPVATDTQVMQVSHVGASSGFLPATSGKPSELGLMPLLPLESSSDLPSAVRVPPLPKCDCGVVH